MADARPLLLRPRDARGRAARPPHLEQIQKERSIKLKKHFPHVRIIHADCREAMRALADNSVDAIVTDPPYELALDGRKWDSTGIAFDVEFWREALRVLK